ncbi:MAG: dihydrolipoamide acetyltransferase family protein [Sphingosinicella sp.]
MARFEFKLPDIGEGIAEAEIVAWHVKVGDRVEEDQQLADLMTDKATVEMESPVSGTVLDVAGAVGDSVPIGSVLVVIETEGAAPAQEDPVADGMVDVPEALEDVVPATENEDAADRPAGDRRSGSDRRSVDRGEPNRRVGEWRANQDGENVDRRKSERRSGDDRRSVDRGAPDRRRGDRRSGERRGGGEVESTREAVPASKALASPAVRRRARDLGIDLAAVRPQGDRIRHADLDSYLLYSGAAVGGGSPRGGGWQDEDVKVVGLRRRIAENMAEAKRRIPHFTYVDEADVTALEQTRAMMNADRGDGPKLTLLPFLIGAMCRALRDYPQINARFDDEAGVVHRSGAVHLGMATQTDHGLSVPVIRNAERRDVWDLAGEILRLAEATRAGKASREELSGSTITISSLGPMGGIVSTPVINRPEVAILAVNKVREGVVVVDGELEIRKLMNLSLSCDHRVVDGWDAASFIQDLKALLENPLRLLSGR